MKKITLMALALMSAAPVLSMQDVEEKELIEVFSGKMVTYKNCDSLHSTPSPSPSPVTPAHWSDLKTTLVAFHYSNCMGNESIPFFVDRLEAIEGAGTSKTQILDKQLAFISSTWQDWEIWRSYDDNQVTRLRYPIIYKFLVKRSQESSSWRDYVCCPQTFQWIVFLSLVSII